jgi:hypothetical protein
MPDVWRAVVVLGLGDCDGDVPAAPAHEVATNATVARSAIAAATRAGRADPRKRRSIIALPLGLLSL